MNKIKKTRQVNNAEDFLSYLLILLILSNFFVSQSCQSRFKDGNFFYMKTRQS